MTRTRSGFTLIELLVVIAIIAILAAILFPVFATARERGRQAKCLSNLKQLASAFTQYADNHNGMYPSSGVWLDGSNADWCGCAGVGNLVYPEKGSLWPYVRTRGVYICPTDVLRPAKACTTPADKKLEGNPDKNGNPRGYALSYSMNWRLHRVKADAAVARKLTRMLLLIHEDRNTINDGLFLWDWDASHQWDVPDKIHYDGTTVAYCDGHARWKSKLQLIEERDAGAWDPGKP